jgi:hypothetical protein
VFLRRLPAAADESGIFGDDRGLGAGRKRRCAESDGKQSNDFPDTRGRVRGRVGNMICFNRDARSLRTAGSLGTARSLGTTDGRHFVSPTCAPHPKRIRRALGHDPIRAEPWLDETRRRINHAFPCQCDHWATARRCPGEHSAHQWWHERVPPAPDVLRRSRRPAACPRCRSMRRVGAISLGRCELLAFVKQAPSAMPRVSGADRTSRARF